MTKNTKNIAILLIIIIAVGAIYYSSNKKSSPETSTATTTTTSNTVTANTPVSNTKTTTPSPTLPKTINTYPSSYANSEYNFDIRFPSYVKAQNYFATFHSLSSNWRLNPAYTNQGKAVISLSIFKIDQGSLATTKSTYPLYFTAEVRIGVSSNVQECYIIDAGYRADGATTINGTTFKKYSYSDTVSTNYTIGESYRTIHNNKCFVLEQIKSGSNLRTIDMAMGTTDDTLNAYYNVGEPIIKTFKFTK